MNARQIVGNRRHLITYRPQIEHSSDHSKDSALRSDQNAHYIVDSFGTDRALDLAVAVANQQRYYSDNTGTAHPAWLHID